MGLDAPAVENPAAGGKEGVMKPIQWGILSTGGIAETFARGLKTSKTGVLAAVASRTRRAAQAFAQKYHVPKAFGTYQELLDDPGVEAVYIAPPHPFHAQWAVLAARAGKHILCEKPLTMDYPDALKVVEAARRNRVFLLEAFMYQIGRASCRERV